MWLDKLNQTTNYLTLPCINDIIILPYICPISKEGYASLFTYRFCPFVYYRLESSRCFFKLCRMQCGLSLHIVFMKIVMGKFSLALPENLIKNPWIKYPMLSQLSCADLPLKSILKTLRYSLSLQDQLDRDVQQFLLVHYINFILYISTFDTTPI
jgi:hypothetical protein